MSRGVEPAPPAQLAQAQAPAQAPDPAPARAAEPDTAAARPALRFGDIDYRINDVYSAAELQESSGPSQSLRQLMNALHADTRRGVLERELLFAEGDPYDPALAAETERNLRSLGFLKNVRVVAQDTLADGRVPVLVTAQEAWTLKTELSYSRAGGEQRWNTSLQDDNFLGQGIGVAVGVGQTEDYSYRSVSFRQRRLLGNRWELAASAADLGDGFSLATELERPFYALDDAWCLRSRAWRADVEQRYYLSNAGPLGEGPTRLLSLHVPTRTHDEGLDVSLLARLGSGRQGRIWRLGGGLAITRLDVGLSGWRELSDDRVVDLGPLATADGALARERGRILQPYVALETRGRDFTATRYLVEYGPREDVSLDPSLALRLGPGFAAGGAGTRLLGDLEAEDWSRLGPGFFLLQGEGEFSLGSHAGDMGRLDLLAGWVATAGQGPVRRQTKLFVEGGWGSGLLGLEPFILGLSRGLRTLDYDGMAGDRLVRWNAEEGLILPVELLGLYRLGLGAFYDGGLAWWQGESRAVEDARHEVGFGLRFGPTRSARGEVARLDLSWPLDGGAPVVTAASRGLF